VLLIAAGLLVRSFVLLEQRPLGFRPDHVLAFSISLPEVSYPEDRQVRAFYERLVRDLRGIPGAGVSAAVSNLPLGGSNSDVSILIEGQVPPAPGQDVLTEYSTATPGYFRTMGIPLLEGREFDETDNEGHPLVAIVGESTARRFWPRGSAVGKRIQLGGEEKWIRIVGVVNDVRWHEFDNEAVTNLYVYLPCDQHPNRNLNLVLRTTVQPHETVSSVRQLVSRLDSDQSISRLRTMEEVVGRANAPRRFNMSLMGAFAVFALLLTGAGVHGTVAQSVASRRRELGIHLALGARPAVILGMFVGQSARLAFVGAAAGLVTALFFRHAVAVLLYGVSAADPLTIAASLIILLLTATLASGMPALRAIRVDPGKVLREQ
jgi:putative ABC transport system permease protein